MHHNDTKKQDKRSKRSNNSSDKDVVMEVVTHRSNSKAMTKTSKKPIDRVIVELIKSGNQTSGLRYNELEEDPYGSQTSGSFTDEGSDSDDLFEKPHVVFDSHVVGSKDIITMYNILFDEKKEVGIRGVAGAVYVVTPDSIKNYRKLKIVDKKIREKVITAEKEFREMKKKKGSNECGGPTAKELNENIKKTRMVGLLYELIEIVKKSQLCKCKDVLPCCDPSCSYSNSILSVIDRRDDNSQWVPSVEEEEEEEEEYDEGIEKTKRSKSRRRGSISSEYSSFSSSNDDDKKEEGRDLIDFVPMTNHPGDSGSGEEYNMDEYSSFDEKFLGLSSGSESDHSSDEEYLPKKKKKSATMTTTRANETFFKKSTKKTKATKPKRKDAKTTNV